MLIARTRRNVVLVTLAIVGAALFVLPGGPPKTRADWSAWNNRFSDLGIETQYVRMAGLSLLAAAGIGGAISAMRPRSDIRS